MKGVVRFGVAMEGALLDQFDRHIHQRGYANRSEALRDLVRGQLAQAAWERGDRTVATITIVYDHHVRELTERLTAIQHDYGDNVVSSLHVHLNHHQCLEVIVARGQANVLKKMADEITRTKGVLVGNITAAPAGEGDE
ncbi:MAG: nickel-responsive transcriptional regulator NikR [Deltaproteobacteria bacterium]|nr:nickel-responsive transcriptional regulator NikR [Deltaproteobacteria bacterium]